MKKVIILFLIIFTTIINTGCTNNDKSTSSDTDTDYIDYSTDMQIMYHAGGNMPMTKSDKGYYYIGEDGIVLFIDKDSKKATPLCAKPNCVHDTPETCDAYLNLLHKPNLLIGSRDVAIQYNEGYLYAMCKVFDESILNDRIYFMRMNPDGSNRENITGYIDFYPIDWFIHRGFLYCSTDSSILRIPLDSPKSEPQVIYHTDYYAESALRAVSILRTYENYLYFSADERDDNDEGPGASANYIDLDTLEVKRLPQVEGEQLYYSCFIGDYLIASYYNSEADENIYFKCDLQGNIIEKMFVNSLLFYSTDGKYIYADNRVEVVKGKSQQQTITVYDLDMNEIDSFVLPKFIEKVCNYINPQDNDYFIFESVNENKERTLVMADKSQIGSIGGKTIECTELCKLKWKDENEDKPYVEANNG